MYTSNNALLLLLQAWQRLQEAVGLREGGTRSGSRGGTTTGRQPRTAKQAALDFYEYYNTKQISRIVEELIADDCVYEVSDGPGMFRTGCGHLQRSFEMHCAAALVADTRLLFCLDAPTNRTWCTRTHLWASRPSAHISQRCAQTSCAKHGFARIPDRVLLPTAVLDSWQALCKLLPCTGGVRRSSGGA